MRDDMFKVIVERPRLVNSNPDKSDGRPFRNREEASRLGMKEGWGNRKWLNENLRPLERFLHKQVNRPWDKVYGEIRAAIDSRSTVKQHILQHLEDFVAIRTQWDEGPKGGRVLLPEHKWGGGNPVPLEESGMELFVHPRTGILLRNRHCLSWDERQARKRRVYEAEKHVVRRILTDRVQLHRIDGVWYEVTLEKLPPAREVVKIVDGVKKRKWEGEKRWDAVRKSWVSIECDERVAPAGSGQDLYGCGCLYASVKRQLNSKEIQKHKLNSKQQTKGLSRPFVFYGALFESLGLSSRA